MKIFVPLSMIIIIMLPLVVYGSEGVREGSTVPTFTLLDENNRATDIGTLIDRPTIIYFTHNACYYCTQIILHLKRAEKKFGRERLRIIGINVMAKDQKLIRAYKEELGFTFPMFAGNREDVLKTYRINYVPVLVFVDSKRVVRKVVGHYIHEPELHKIIREIIKG
ncbi:MAG: hypothetical protein OHK0032_06910 [Thermodesulfovibrionales bacterium]